MAGRTREHRGKTYTLTAAHPAADLFPWLDGDELQALADDIKANGLKHKIVRHRGKIVDGRNREFACLVAGVRPDYADLPTGATEEKILAGVITANLKRRHLSTSQRAMIAADLATMRQGDRTDKEPSAALRKVGQGETTGVEPSAALRKVGQAEAAAQLGVSPRSVQNAAKVKRDAPELVGPVQNGKLDVHTAARVAEYPEQVREAVAGADDPKAAADELLDEMHDLPEDDAPTAGIAPLNGTLPVPRIDAGAKNPHPLYGDRKRAARKLDDHRYGKILTAMRDLSRAITLAMNAPDGGKLKDYLRFFGLVLDRGFILNGKKYNARFKGFMFRHAVKIAVGKKPPLSKDELLRVCREQWDDGSDMEGWVPE